MEAQYEPHDHTKENTYPPLPWSFGEDFFFNWDYCTMFSESHTGV